MNSSQQQLERIVAYLDGELSTEESTQVEQQLAADEQFRQELQGAERAWTALDELPMAQVSDEFSRTTMAMVVNAARHDIQARTIALPVQRRRRKTATALLATMTVLLGALVFRVLWKNPNRRLLADLPVIQNVDIYSQFRSIDFLQQLHRGLRSQRDISSSEAEQLQAKSKEFLLVSSADNREDWLELLSDDERIVLRAKFNRFRDLSAKRQAEMRLLHHQLYATSDRDQLLETLFRYQQWLGQLQPSEQFEYRALSASDRARRVAREMEQTANEQEFDLSQEQLTELFRKIRPRIEELILRLRPTFERELSKMPRQRKWEFHSLSKPEQVRRAFQFVLKESPEDFRKLSQAIVEALPTEAGQAFQKLSPKLKAEQMRVWAWQFRFQASGEPRSGSKRNPSQISEQELSDYFAEELDSTQKEQLLALPRDEMHQQLKRMLVHGQFSRRGRHGPPERGDPPPPHGPPAEGRRRDRRGGPGMSPPRGDSRFFESDQQRPPRGPSRDRPRRRPPEQHSPEE